MREGGREREKKLPVDDKIEHNDKLKSAECKVQKKEHQYELAMVSERIIRSLFCFFCWMRINRTFSSMKSIQYMYIVRASGLKSEFKRKMMKKGNSTFL